MKNPLTLYPELEPVMKKCQEEMAKIIGCPITVDIHIVKVHRLREHHLALIVSEAVGMPWKEITNKTRKATAVIGRQLYAYFARTELDKTLSKIGEDLGTDHSTALWSVRKVEDMIATNDDLYCPLLDTVKKRISEVRGV